MKKIYLESGAEIFYRAAGYGPPAILQHGWGGSSQYWQGTMGSLSDIRTVYALDLPGYGQSPPVTVQEANPEFLASLIIEFADALGLERFDLIGHSFGSNLVSYVAADNPHRVNQMVLTCPATYRNEGERRMIKVVHTMMGMTLRLRRPWISRVPTLYRRFSGRFFHRLPKDANLLREGFEDFLRMDRRTASESAISAANDAVNGVLSRVTVPTLVIGASNDSIMPRHGPSTVAQFVPNSRLIWIEDCGHLPMVERPEVYHWLLRDFLLGGMTLQAEPEEMAHSLPRPRMAVQEPAPEAPPRPAAVTRRQTRDGLRERMNRPSRPRSRGDARPQPGPVPQQSLEVEAEPANPTREPIPTRSAPPPQPDNPTREPIPDRRKPAAPPQPDNPTREPIPPRRKSAAPPRLAARAQTDTREQVSRAQEQAAHAEEQATIAREAAQSVQQTATDYQQSPQPVHMEAVGPTQSLEPAEPETTEEGPTRAQNVIPSIKPQNRVTAQQAAAAAAARQAERARTAAQEAAEAARKAAEEAAESAAKQAEVAAKQASAAANAAQQAATAARQALYEIGSHTSGS